MSSKPEVISDAAPRHDEGTSQRRAPGYSLLALPRFRRDPVKALLAATREHGDVVRFSFGPVQMILAVHPDAVQRVLVDNVRAYDKESVGYGKLKLALGDGLLTAGGDFWRRQRRIIQPAFHGAEIRRFASVITTSTDEMLARWEVVAAAGEAIDVPLAMMALALDVICKAMFSTDINDRTELLGELMTTAIHYINERMLSVLSIFDFPEKLPTPANRRFREAIRQGDVLVGELIAERRAQVTNPGDLLSLLMNVRDVDTGEGMTDRQLRDEVITIFAAGHETTANVLAWTWHLLAEHPEVVRRIHDEVDRVLGGPAGRVPAADDLRTLPFTTAVVKESMRLFPPAWVMSRRATTSDVLGEFDVPAGSMVLLSPFLTHRHPSFFADPERFDPERFIDGRDRAIPRGAYFPFGAGQRICVGKELAMMEAVLIVARIAQRFSLDRVGAAGDVSLDALVTLRPRGGMRMRLHRRAEAG